MGKFLQAIAEREKAAKLARRSLSLSRQAKLKGMSADLARRFQFRELYLFGSTATLQAHESSDLDLYAPGITFSNLALMQSKLEIEFQVPIDILDADAPAHLLQEIHRTGIRLYPALMQHE